MTVNWCWGQWGFKFKTLKKWIKKLPFVDEKKLDSLYYDIETKACNPHDERFEEGWNIFDFLAANRDFAQDVISLMRWTTSLWRLFIFCMLFFWTSIFWIKYFNWK